MPLARLYAKYFGGTLHLAPMEGYGTDCYATFNRLAGQSIESIDFNLRGDEDPDDDEEEDEPNRAFSLFSAQSRGTRRQRGEPD